MSAAALMMMPPMLLMSASYAAEDAPADADAAMR